MTTTDNATPESQGITSRQEWRKSWTVVLAAFVGVSLGSLHIYSTGLFIEPLESEMGWSRTEITSGLTLISVVGAFFSPFVGLMIDRCGARSIAVPGAILYCVAFGSLSLTGPSIWNWWGLWFLIACLALMQKPTVWSAAVSSHFIKSRGLAIAITFCGAGLGSSIIPLITHTLISEFGWRIAYIGLGAIFFLISVPTLVLFFHDARKSHTGHGGPVEAADSPVIPGWSVKQGFKSRQFFQLTAAALLITAVVVGMVVHVVPLLTESGLPRPTVVKIVSLIGIMSIVGRLSVGYLFDRLPGPPVGMCSVGLPALSAVIILLFPDSLPLVVLAVIILGLAVGGEYDAIIYLSTRYFGLRNFGTLFGFVASMILAGVGLGPLLGGLLYDLAGDYRVFLMVVIPMSLITSILLGTLGKYPDHTGEE